MYNMNTRVKLPTTEAEAKAQQVAKLYALEAIARTNGQSGQSYAQQLVAMLTGPVTARVAAPRAEALDHVA